MAFTSKMCARRGFRAVAEDAGPGWRVLVGRGHGAVFSGPVRTGPRTGSGAGSEAGLGRGWDATRPVWNFRWR